MAELTKSMKKMGITLALFGFVSASAISLANWITKEKIDFNENQFLLSKLNKILPKTSYDNNLTEDTKQVKADLLLGTTDFSTVYLAKKNNRIITVFLSPIAIDGYNGEIKLLVAVDYKLNVVGVRVVKHQETVGLADGIEDNKSDWILGFNNKSLSNTAKWLVKKDGGEFDQFTGATISPRAIVKAVKQTLMYVQQHQQELFN